MEKLEKYFNEQELATIKNITAKINNYSKDLDKKSELEALGINRAITALKEDLEELRIFAFKREYAKLEEDDQYQLWLNEFESQIKSRTGGDYLYNMFSLEQYQYWNKLDENFDELFLQLCLDFDLEYEFAFALCEYEQGSQEWNHLIDINKD